MSDCLNKATVLVLNHAWQRIRWTTVQKAIVALTGGLSTPPALVVDVVLNEGGSYAPGIAYSWEDWVKLPVESHHVPILTTSGAIRCPMVIVEPNFTRMPVKLIPLSSKAILERDGYVDQYTGEKLTHGEASVDHVIPKDVWKKRGLKGSPNTWENMVACQKKRNHAKGNKLNSQVGYVLTRKPKAPKPLPVSSFIREARHPAHQPFIT